MPNVDPTTSMRRKTSEALQVETNVVAQGKDVGNMRLRHNLV